MKKKILLYLLSSCAFYASFSQIDLGIKGGLNLSTAKFSNSNENKSKLAFYGGFISQFVISEKILIRPELLFSRKGYRFAGTSNSSNGSVSLDYISVPLLGGFSASKKLTILVGPEFNFLTSATASLNGNNVDQSDLYNKFDMAIDLGLSYQIQKKIALELRYSRGFEDLMDITFTDQEGNIIKRDKIGSNRNLHLGLIYLFNKK